MTEGFIIISDIKKPTVKVMAHFLWLESVKCGQPNAGVHYESICF